jgi:hypothetical protein
MSVLAGLKPVDHKSKGGATTPCLRFGCLTKATNITTLFELIRYVKAAKYETAQRRPETWTAGAKREEGTTELN